MIESRLPKDWWKHPVFDLRFDVPAPYIWFGYWLIIWYDWEDLDNKFSWKNLSIKFLPD